MRPQLASAPPAATEARPAASGRNPGHLVPARTGSLRSVVRTDSGKPEPFGAHGGPRAGTGVIEVYKRA